MKRPSVLIALGLGIILFSCSKDQMDEQGPARPAAGSSRTIIQEINYVNGQIEGSSSWATWPVASFAADANAVQYSVRVLNTGKTYTWKSSETTRSEYHVYPSSNDIKDGQYYIGLGRTWCAGCSSYNSTWEQNYRSSVFAGNSKVEITFFY